MHKNLEELSRAERRALKYGHSIQTNTRTGRQKIEPVEEPCDTERPSEPKQTPLLPPE